MCASATAKTDRTLGLKPAAPWRVATVKAIDGFRLEVEFMDGHNGIVDLSLWLGSPRIDDSLFEPLRDLAFFRQVHLELGAVVWSNGADLPPDVMYDAIRQCGCWIPN